MRGRAAPGVRAWARGPYDSTVPVYICPNCKNRSIDSDGYEGFTDQVPQCHRCGFGFLFELLEDYYPAPSTGFVVCDADARVIAVGRGVFELTGYGEGDLLGRPLVEALALSDAGPLELVREWGVRRLGEELELDTRAGFRKPVTVDFFPAYDEDGGLLVALTPRSSSNDAHD
jgi:PAS domain-containing protein